MHAARLWGDNSLVVADLRQGEAISLRELARASSSSLEKEALRRRAWALLVPVHAPEEVTYYPRTQAFICKAKDKTVPSEAVLQGMGAVLGYATLLRAAFHSLALLVELRGFALVRDSAKFFVLTALDAIPRTATIDFKLDVEADVVATMDMMATKPENFEPSFYAAVLRKWRSSAVADVLRARGSLQTGVATHQKSNAGFEARKRADIEKFGLRECAWPSCDKVGWSAPSASSSSAPAVAPCGTAAWSITRSTGGRTKRIAKSWTKRGGR